MATTLSRVKTALRITADAYDYELTDLIYAALTDLGVAGVSINVLETEGMPSLVRQAVITYCKMNFGLPEDYDKLKRSYDEQKAQMSTATGYTDWLEVCRCMNQQQH